MYLSQCCWVMVANVYAIRKVSNACRYLYQKNRIAFIVHTIVNIIHSFIHSFIHSLTHSLIATVEAITSPLKVALLLNPSFGYARFYRGGIALASASYLDAIFFYFTALNAEDPYDCKEALNAAFDRCVYQHNLLQDGNRNVKKTNGKTLLRLMAMKYLSIVGKIWTRVDIDALEEMIHDFEWSLKELLRRCALGGNSTSSGNALSVKSEVFNEMMACLLICIDLCLKMEDPRNLWKEYSEMSGEEKPPMFVISNKDACK